MTTYAYLEQALNADGVEAIQETNQELLDKATQLIDELVKEEHEFSSTHLGQHIVEGALEETYENVQEPTSDVVIEAVSTFADIISSVEYDDEEKVGLMECASALIESEEDPMKVLIEDASVAFIAVGKKLAGSDVSSVKDLGTSSSDTAGILAAIQSGLSDIGSDISSGFSVVKTAIGSGTDASSKVISDSVKWWEEFAKTSGIDGALRSGFNSVLDTVKENTNLGQTGAPVVAGGMIVLVLILAIFIAVKLWKAGSKKQALKLFGAVKKLFSKIKSKFKK